MTGIRDAPEDVSKNPHPLIASARSGVGLCFYWMVMVTVVVWTLVKPEARTVTRSLSEMRDRDKIKIAGGD
jgi:hypothetical protein